MDLDWKDEHTELVKAYLKKWNAIHKPLPPDFPQDTTNLEWLRANPHHSLYYRWALLYNYSEEWARTCSEVTAYRLAEQFGPAPLEEWDVVHVGPGKVDMHAPLSVINVADKHWFVLRKNVVYHSRLGQWEPRQENFDSAMLVGLCWHDLCLFFAEGFSASSDKVEDMWQHFPPGAKSD